MTDATHMPIEEMTFFQKLEETSDQLFDHVSRWSHFNQETVGKQLVKAYDSVGANLVEGDGRHTQPDAIKFFTYSRASGREARFWLRRAMKRGLLKPDVGTTYDLCMEQSLKATNKIISFRRSVSKQSIAKETLVEYDRVLEDIEGHP